MMPHVAASLSGMQNSSKRFGEIDTGIDDPREMFHDKIFLFASFLDGKMLDVNVLSTGCGMLFIEDMESSHIVNEQACQVRSKSFKCCEDVTKTLDNLSTGHM